MLKFEIYVLRYDEQEWAEWEANSWEDWEHDGPSPKSFKRERTSSAARSSDRKKAKSDSKNDEHAPGGGEWPLAYMNSFGVTIAAGANEVQRNILGERVLGMPKSK